MTEKIRRHNDEMAQCNVDTGADKPKWSYARQLLLWSGYVTVKMSYDL